MNRPAFVHNQLEKQIQQGRLALIVEQNAATFIASNLVSPLLIALILALTEESSKNLIPWIGFGLLLCAARALHHKEFKNFAAYSKPAIQWEFELIILSILSGFFWAASGILFIHPENPGLSVFIIASIFAHISAAVASHASHIRIFIAFCFSLWIPASAFFITMNSNFYNQLVILGSFFVLANLSFALNQSRSVTQSLRLQYENDKLLNELKQQKLIADEANRAKSQFIAAASHDLRQPLHAMNLFADSLEQRIENQETGRILGLLKNSMNTLRELFDSLLDISRLDAGIIKPQPKDFDLVPMIQKILDENSLHASNKGLHIRFRSGHNSAGHWVHSDPVLVEQILRNLIWNAIKYTESGGILAALRQRRARVVFEVWDTGPGILEADQDRIFEEFHQTNNPDRDRSQGIGLGLSIVQRTAKLLDLEVGMDSVYGKGSKFSVGFKPVEKPAALPLSTEPTATKQLDSDLSGVSVLVVDDEESILDALEVLLQNWGCNVVTCKTIDQVRHVLEEFNPDILLTDFRLRNKETGSMVIYEVQQATGFETPSIIITGTAFAETLNHLKKQNIEVVYKPLQAEELRKKMIEALNH